MRWRATHVSRFVLTLLAVVSLGVLALVEHVRSGQAKPHAVEKRIAAQKMAQAIGVIAEHRITSGHAFDLERDPYRTGLIGSEFTPITTDRGTLSAKQIVTNPNFAALMVQILKDAGLAEGDTVAIAWSGSLPGANIAVLAAVETLTLRAIPISSIPASMSGANDPEFAWLDMEKLLADRGVFSTRSVAATLGGDEDTGKGLGRIGRDLVRAAARRCDVPLINEPTFAQQVARRMEIYRTGSLGRPIKAYINVGGGIGSLGARINGQIVRPGLNASARGMLLTRDGTMTRMLKQKIPVIHVNYIDRLCRRYEYPTDPEADRTPGAGPMFYRREHIAWLVAGGLVGLLVTYFVAIRLDVVSTVRGRRREDLMM